MGPMQTDGNRKANVSGRRKQILSAWREGSGEGKLSEIF